MSNINDTYFEGYYKEIWKSIIPDELTIKEVDFMIPYFHLTPDKKVLDLMCGYGRHSIALGKKGIHVTAIDNLEDYIFEINTTAVNNGLPVKAVKSNVIGYKIDDSFDLVICMGNSLNFFNAEDISILLSAISANLNPGGHLLINSWSLAEISFKNFKEKTWSNVDNIKFLNDSKIYFHPTRIETETTMIAADGNTEIKMAVDYIYSINELENMLLHAGLLLKDVYSIPGRKKFSIGEPRAYIIAEKSSKF